MSRRLAPALALAGALAAAAAPAADRPSLELRAELAPDPVGLDELAVLTLTVEASGLGMPRVEPGFLLDNFEGAGGPSRSQSTSWVNGESSSRLELAWRLRPLATGRARVHSIRVELGQEVRSLADLAVTVVERAPTGRPAPRAGRTPADPFARLFEDDPFGLFPRRRTGPPQVEPKLALRSLVAPTTAWVGEQVVWTLALDTQTDIAGFRPHSLPEFAGFWARELELPQPPRPEWIEVEGEKFGRVAMLARALFPLRAGELEIERVPVEVVARMPADDWIGGGLLGRDRPLELSARPVKLRVRPLPPAPPGFGGVVGASSLAATLEPPSVAVGQAATFRLRLVTAGNPRGATAPALAIPAGLRSFPPETTSAERLVGGRLESEVEWRYVLLADARGDYELPPVAWSYFDPAAGRYLTATTAPLRLAVVAAAKPAGTAEPPPAAPANAPAPPARPDSGAARTLALAALAGAAALAVVLAWRRRAPSEARRLRQALDEARAVAAPRDAAKAIDAAWRRLLAERYGVGRGTPVAQWPAALGAAGWRPDRIAELQRLFEEIHLLEFAPELADADAMRADIDRRSRELARRLR